MDGMKSPFTSKFIVQTSPETTGYRTYAVSLLGYQQPTTAVPVAILHDKVAATRMCKQLNTALKAE